MRRAALIALLALAASACSLDIRIGISLERNGSGSVSVDIAADEEFLELYRLTGRDFEDLIATRGPAVGLPFTVSPGTVTRYRAESSVVSAETLAGILEGLVPGIGDVTITAGAEALEFDGRLNPLTGIADVAPYFADEDPLQFGDAVTVAVTLALPGEIDSSTGTSGQEDGLAWTIPFSDSDTRLFARSVLEREGRAVPWTLVIAALTLVVAAGFLLAIRSSLAEAREKAGPKASPQQKPSSPPEQQPVAPEATPPEDQPVAPPADTG